MPDTVSGSLNFVPVIRNSCRSQFSTKIIRECNPHLNKNTSQNFLRYHNDIDAVMDHHLHISHFVTKLSEFFANKKISLNFQKKLECSLYIEPVIPVYLVVSIFRQPMESNKRLIIHSEWMKIIIRWSIKSSFMWRHLDSDYLLRINLLDTDLRRIVHN